MGFWGAAYDTFRRELGRIARDRLYFALTVLLPVISFAFFACLLQRGVARNIPIAVLDQDHSPLSRTLTRMIDATPTAAVAYGIEDIAEGERLMREGEIMAIVLIPGFFEKDIYGNRQSHVETYITGTNITVNGLLSKDIQTTVATFTAGIQMQLLGKLGMTRRQAMAQIQPVRFDRHVLFNPYINYSYYLSPSFMPMMLLIFTIMVTIYAVGSELKSATAGQWFATARGSVMAALAGKLLPITAVMFLTSQVMFLIIFKVVGVPLNGSLALLVLASLLFIVSYQAIGTFLVAVLSNMRLALSLGGGYSVLAFTFSGLTFPIMAMHRPMQWFSRIFPFTYYTDIIIDQALRGAPPLFSVHDMGMMGLFILLPLLCLPRLRRISTDERYWRRR